MDYINLKHKPSKKELVTEYHAEPNGMSMKECCQNIALESSIGTWTTISTMNPRIAHRLKPKVFSINNKTKEVKIAYPQDLFEKGNMPEILSSIAGNIYGMKAVKNLRLQDISFPEDIIKSFKGPKFGIKGIRRLTKLKKRPLIGTIVKPKVGLTEKQHAKVAYDAWHGGLDVVKDDENLSSMTFNNFYKRAKETLKLRDKAEKETGEKKIYMPNITSETREMIKRAKFVKDLGCEYMMIDILTCGWSALQTMRDENEDLKLVIHAHRAMHGALTRNPRHGMSMMTIAKIARLIGVDQLHIGTAAVGKMHGSKSEELAIEENIEEQNIKGDDSLKVLNQEWGKIKPVLAVASGGLHPGHLHKVMDIMGKDIVMQFGGGCHGHPHGTYAGAKAIREALDSAMQGINLKDAIKDKKNLALKTAIDKWRY